MEYTYLSLLQDIYYNGEDRTDRTGVGTRSLFGRQMRFNLRKAFPAVTTKKLAWKSVVSELLWFIEGSGDERRLAEILHGTRDAVKKTIWTGNANADYWKPKAKFEGDLGRVYGVQWRNWKTYSQVSSGGLTSEFEPRYIEDASVDQLTALVTELKKDPHSRRHILTAWNPGELDQMALPPCHMFAQFYVGQNDRSLSCQVYIRSNDMFLGAPFNIASYALFVHMLAQVTDLNVGDLVITIGDAHIYNNHLDQVKEQLTRKPFDPPQLWINPNVKSIDGFSMSDFRLDGYNHHQKIEGDMAV